MDDKYVYVFIRLDHSEAERVIHSAHAVERLATLQRYSEQGVPSLIAFGVRSEYKMRRALEKVEVAQLPHFAWTDPDDPKKELRALAVGPLDATQKQVLAEYRLYSPGAPKGSCLLAEDGGAKGRPSSEKEHSTFSREVAGSIPADGSIANQ